MGPVFFFLSCPSVLLWPQALLFYCGNRPYRFIVAIGPTVFYRGDRPYRFTVAIGPTVFIVAIGPFRFIAVLGPSGLYILQSHATPTVALWRLPWGLRSF
jgi:hypothetical protein